MQEGTKNGYTRERERRVKNTDFFFVYGTLKMGGYFSREFDAFRLLSIPATLVDYNLYDLGSFPAIYPGEGKVIGELHKYKGLDFVVNRIDQIEGYSEHNPEGSLYIRKRENVITSDGDTINANVYVFNQGNLTGAKIVTSGIWKL